MKILAIRGCNIASLAGDFEVDFTAEPLRSAGIFAIAGPTGAGKSTLLDVMTLALYDETPRLSAATNAEGQSEETTVSDTRNLMTRGTGDARAEVDFVATTGERYRATWEAHRARGKADGKLQNVSVRLVNLDTDTEVKGKKTDTLRAIAELVGLQYEQFTRTVVLAQGEFSKFIKAKEADRASILEKLTGTEIYSVISKQIFERTSAMRADLEKLEARMMGREPLPEEKVAELREADAQLTDAIKQTGKELEQLKQLMTWFVDVDKRQQAVADTQEALTRLAADEEAMAPRYALAQTWRRAGRALSLLARRHELTAKLADNANATLRYEAELKGLQEEKSTLAEQEKVFEEEKKQFEAGTEAFNSLVEQANLLGSDIANTGKQLDEHKKAADAASALRQKASEMKLEAEREIASAEKEQHEAAGWIERNEGRRDVANNKALIVYQLNEASELQSANLEADKELAGLDKDLSGYNKEKAEATLAMQQAASQSSELKAAVAMLAEQLKGTDLEAMRRELTARGNRKTALERLLPIAQRMNELLQQRREKEESLQKLEATIAQLTTEQSDTEKARLVADGRKQEAQMQLDRVRLMAAENVATLRTALVEGEACPVCGATAHPFAHERDDIFARLLADAGRTFEQATKSFDELDQRLAKLGRDLAKLHASAEATRSDLSARIIPDWEKLRLSWSNAPLSDHYLPDNVASTIALLEQDIASAETCRRELEERIAMLDAVAQKLREQEKQLSEVLAKATQLDGKIGQLELRIEADSNKEKRIRAEIANRNKQIDDLLNSINRYFNASEWQENWKKDPIRFAKQIELFASDWASKEKLIADKKEQIMKLQQTQREAMGDEQRASQALGDASLRCNEATERIQASRRKLAELTGGQTVDGLKLTRKRLTDDLNNRSIQLAQRQKGLVQQEGELSGGLKALAEAKEMLGKELTATGDCLTAEIASLGIDEVRLTELSLVPEADVATIEAAKRQADERGIALRTQCSAAEKELADLLALRPAETGREEAEHLQQAHSNMLDELQKQLEDVRGQLAVNDRNIREMAALKHQIDAKRAEVDNWNTLNSLLGSRDGAKFQKIAQSYTLDLLLLSANEQLRSIAPRYLLERIPDSLSLRVIDRDMCDEVRSVFSLSGGETFLVSLALALGLASLSSRGMNIESLFIDEGFGSLDENTLMVTMDALESLHMQGRKVGVISHVAEMTERIAAQIRIKKLQSGVSKIEIKG